jgi:hypothetical protein
MVSNWMHVHMIINDNDLSNGIKSYGTCIVLLLISTIHSLQLINKLQAVSFCSTSSLPYTTKKTTEFL